MHSVQQVCLMHTTSPGNALGVKEGVLLLLLPLPTRKCPNDYLQSHSLILANASQIGTQGWIRVEVNLHV